MACTIFSVAGNGGVRIGVMARPQGGASLEEEVRSIREQGFAVLVSLLSEDEQRELELTEESTHCESVGLNFKYLPITDLSVPELNQQTIAFLAELRELHSAGNSIAVHCRAGLGRAPMIAACVMLSPGCSIHSAFHQLSAARGFNVPETPQQHQWAASYEKLLLTPKSSP